MDKVQITYTIRNRDSIIEPPGGDEGCIGWIGAVAQGGPGTQSLQCSPNLNISFFSFCFYMETFTETLFYKKSPYYWSVDKFDLLQFWISPFAEIHNIAKKSQFKIHVS